MKHLDITLDFETCGLSANAAVLQLGAVAWNRTHDKEPFLVTDKNGKYINDVKPLKDFIIEPEDFNQSFDLRDQVFAGREFAPDTVENFWACKAPEAVKASILTMEPISTHDVLLNFTEWVKDLVAVTGADSVCLWSQGTDFDIAILRSLTSQFNVELPRNLYKNFRDCRTYIQEVGSSHFLDNPLDSVTNPSAIYKAIEARFGKCPQLTATVPTASNTPAVGSKPVAPHDALYDAINSTWNTWHCLRADNPQ